MGKSRESWWWALLPVAVVALYVANTPFAWLLGGLIAIAGGVIVALDIGGVADTVPRFVARSWVDRASIGRGRKRLNFALLAGWGLVMVVLALGRSR